MDWASPLRPLRTSFFSPPAFASPQEWFPAESGAPGCYLVMLAKSASVGIPKAEYSYAEIPPGQLSLMPDEDELVPVVVVGTSARVMVPPTNLAPVSAPPRPPNPPPPQAQATRANSDVQWRPLEGGRRCPSSLLFPSRPLVTWPRSRVAAGHYGG